MFNNERNLLLENGFEVFSYEKHNDDLSEVGLVDKLQVAKNCVWNSTAYSEVRESIREFKPHVAHFHNTFPQMSPSVYQACKDEGVPVVQTLHNYRLVCPGALLSREGRPCELCLDGSLVHALRYRCYRDSLPATGTLVSMLSLNRVKGSYEKNVDRYIALTRFAKSRMIKGGLPEPRISIKPNFLVDQSRRFDARAEDRSYVVFVGRLDRSKGVHTLLEAWKLLPDVPLKIIGDGPDRKQLEALVKKENLQVEFTGFLDKQDILDFVSKAVFQCVPSEWYEGFPMVMLEAFSMGTPILASSIGSVDEIVEDGKTGLKFSVGDAQDLAKKAAQMWIDRDTTSTQGEEARMTYENFYTPKKNIEALRGIYESAISSAELHLENQS